MSYGISGERAPELAVPYWIDALGNLRHPLELSELGPRHRVLFFYQHWCPGCHSHGFPALLSLIERTRGTDVGVAVVQTVFEGGDVNTAERLLEDQRRYQLRVPFGHEGQTGTGRPPTTMENFRTGGTPWFVTIDAAGVVMQDGFAIDVDQFVTSAFKANTAP